MSAPTAATRPNAIAGRHGIIGLHEDSTRLYEQPHAFWAVVNRATRRIAAGPFDHQSQASASCAEAQRRGLDVVIVGYQGKAARGEQTLHLDLALGEQNAWDLAQFLKRAGFSEFRACAVDQDEAYRMIAAADKVRRALADAGVDPR